MITSVQNPWVKQLRKLHAPKYRRQQGLFLLEGTHLIQEAVVAQWPLESICYTEAWQRKEQRLWQQLQSQGLRCEEVSAEVLSAIATTVNPDGVVAIAKSRPAENNSVAIHSLGLVLETLQDPGNAGTILRTAAAAGVEGILLNQDSVDLENPKVLRASAGAWFRVAATPCDDLLDQVQHYRNQGFQIVATTPNTDLAYWTVDYTQPTLIAVGNEGAGLSDELLQAATVQVQIPLSAGVESLNVAIATAVILYEAKRQRTQAHDIS